MGVPVPGILEPETPDKGGQAPFMVGSVALASGIFFQRKLWSLSVVVVVFLTERFDYLLVGQSVMWLFYTRPKSPKF